jgi:hypothetical protein
MICQLFFLTQHLHFWQKSHGKVLLGPGKANICNERPEMTSPGSRLREGYGGPREIREGQNNERKINLMKNRSCLTIFATILSVLVCFGLSPQMQGAPQVVPAPDGCYPGFTTAEGCNALNFLGAGAGNTGVGWYSLFSVGDANFNTGVGAGTLVLNGGDSNTAVGAAALLLNTTGTRNTAVGTDALVFNDSGTFNDAVGGFALYANDSGFSNNAFGDSALNSNISGNNNTAVGDLALLISTGDNNTALGAQAGIDQDTGSNNIYVGDTGVAGESDVIAIGAIPSSGTAYVSCFIGGIAGATIPVANAAPVLIDTTTGQLATITVDANGNPATAPVRRGKATQPQAKLNHKVEELQATVAQQQKQIKTLTAQLKEQAAQIQKVSAQLEVRKPAPRVVVNKR